MVSANYPTVGEPLDQAAKANELLDELFLRGEQACVSDIVISEVYFALQYHYNVPKKEALQSIKNMLDSGDVVSTGVAKEVLQIKNLASAKPGFVDRLILAGYCRDSRSMATFEKKSHKLEGVQVL
jgi:predicted nucleic acid-binding protein